MINQPLWFRVVCHFNDKNYFSNGLTIPFLLGANSIINIEDEILSVEAFFAEVIDENLPRKISLQKCNDIGQYVFGIVDAETIEYAYEKATSKQIGNIYITDDSFSTIDDVKEVKRILINEAQHLLDKRTYSINDGIWGDYTDSEKLKLEELK